MINVGEKYTFKLTKTRGRPYVAEVVRKAGVFAIVKTRGGDELRVPTKILTRPHEFKPYNTKARRAAAEAAEA